MKPPVISPGADLAVDGFTSIARVECQRPTTSPLQAALAGDRDAWEGIVRDHTKLLWWIARSHRLDDATAADVVQTVWLQLVRFGDRIDDPRKLGGWLSTTARREALRRTSGREVPTEWVGEDPDLFSPEVDEQLLDDEAIGVVLAAFEQLSADDQRILRLITDIPPKSYQEIAALLGKTPGYVGPTRQRALQRLRVILKEMGMS